VSLRPVHPAGFAPARGYSAGMVATGPVLYVAGQVGWDAEQRFASDDFAAQFASALDNVLAVVRAAGGRPEDVAQMTIFVTDIAAYRRSTRALGLLWRERLGRHYPAMALVAVSALVEPRALVEIQAVAHLQQPDRAEPGRPDPAGPGAREEAR
jgi:enamine deaminase RidA (YjgF/YER057c/UK114 family)